MATSAPFQQRRLHLQVGAHSFLPVTLRIFCTQADQPSQWFGEPQLQELMELLHAEVPNTLPPLIAQRTPQRSVPMPLNGKHIAVCLTFLPTTSATWLVTNGGHDGNSSISPALAAVPFTLLCDVEPRQPVRRQRQTTLG